MTVDSREMVCEIVGKGGKNPLIDCMSNSSKKPVRIKDIAQTLNMPVSTVGNILKNDLRYTEELRQQVWQSAEKMGYRRNILASGLRGGKTNTIGVIWSLGPKQSAAEVIRELSYLCFARGYTTLISDSRSDVKIIEEVLSGFMDRKVDGVVFQWGSATGTIPGAVLEKLRNFSNVVLVQPKMNPYSLKSVVVSVEKGISQLVDYWAGQGRKKPAILIPTGENMHKVEAFIQSFARHGIHVNEEAIFGISSKGSMFCRYYYDYLVSHFAQNRFPHDALFCGTDEGALGAIQWLRENHFRVPEDVAVVGFNNSEFTQFSYPPIASIGRSEVHLAEALVTLLFEESEESEQVCEIDVPYGFVWRASAGAEKNS